METEAAAAGGAAAGGGIGASDLAAVLGQIMGGGSGSRGGLNAAGLAAALQGLQQQRGLRPPASAADPGPTLGDVLKPELLAPLLQAPDVVQRLAPYLPEEHR